MKKLLCLLIVAALCAYTLSLPVIAVNEFPQISAYSYVLIRSGSNETIVEKNADEEMLIASTTKIMTAIVVIENCDLDDEVIVNPEWCGVEGSSMYIAPGETYTVWQLLMGMMLVSGNDAAYALACYVAGSTDAFACMMNAKAVELGMNNTSYRNPHGLDEEGHYSTARDLAVLTSYCMLNSAFVSLVSTKTADIKGRTLINHNKLLWNCNGCLGVKTGYTMAAGRSLVSCCERNGIKYVFVTLGDSNDWDDHNAVYDWVYDKYRVRTIIGANNCYLIPVIAGTKNAVTVIPSREIKMIIDRDADIKYKVELPRFVFAEIVRGDEIGTITAYKDDSKLASAKLVYSNDVYIDRSARLNSWERLFKLGSLYTRPYYSK